MELEGVVKDIMNISNTRTSNQAPTRINVPDGNLSSSELASVLNVLAGEYKTTLPSLLRRLDSVSGSLEHLDRFYAHGDEKVCWSEEEDALL